MERSASPKLTNLGEKDPSNERPKNQEASVHETTEQIEPQETGTKDKSYEEEDEEIVPLITITKRNNKGRNEET